VFRVAVDVGFGRVKAINDTGNSVNFPAVVAGFQPLVFSSGLEAEGSLAIEYQGKKYWVGEAAIRQSTAVRMTTDRARTISEEGMTLLAAGLAQMVEKDHELTNLVVGLPVKFYSGMKEEYHNLVRDVHKINLLMPGTGEVKTRRLVIAEEARELPQPFGTLFDTILDNSGGLRDKELAAGRVGIIDIGFNTLDLARADSLEYINPASDSFSGQGLFSAFQDLSHGLFRELEIEIPPEKIEPIARNAKITLAGKEHDISKLVDQAFTQAAEGVISRVKSLWPDRERWQFTQVLITGGGGALLSKYIIPLLGVPARIVENPVMANARGYLKFGRRVWK